MPTAIITDKATAAAADELRDLNGRVLDAGKKAGHAYLDAYEKMFSLVAEYQQKLAEQSEVEWVSTVVGAQAKFTREVAELQASTGRELLK
jgi:hypothetical protein